MVWTFPVVLRLTTPGWLLQRTVGAGSPVQFGSRPANPGVPSGWVTGTAGARNTVPLSVKNLAVNGCERRYAEFGPIAGIVRGVDGHGEAALVRTVQSGTADVFVVHRVDARAFVAGFRCGPKSIAS